MNLFERNFTRTLGSLILLVGISGCAEFCTSDKKLCLKTTPTTNLMRFEVSTNVQGWAAIGFGSSMRDADIMMVYVKDGRFLVQDRYSTSRSLPPLSEVQASRIDNATSKTVGGVNYFSFFRALAFSDSQHRILDKGVSPMIWAYSNTPVSDSPSIHSQYGSFRLDLFSSDSVTAGVSDKVTLTLVHGIMMFFAWNIFTPIGVFIARYMKKSLGEKWFRWHVILLVGSILFTIIGFSIAVSFTSSDDHFQNGHQALGLIIFIFAVLQGFLGQFINVKFDPNRMFVPWYDKVHWVLGRVLFLLGIANVIYGLVLFSELYADYKESAMAFLWTTVALTVLTFIGFIFGQVHIGQTHHQESPGSNFQDYIQDYYKENNEIGLSRI